MPRPRTISDATILAAAAKTLQREGPAGVTFQAVAKEVGLSPATLVQRFGSKRGLLLAFAQTATTTAGDELRRAREQHRSPLRALQAGLATMAGGLGTREAMARGLAFLQLDIGDEEFARPAAAWSRKVRHEITATLNEAQEAGELDPGTDITRLTELVESVYHGALISWALSGENQPLERWLARRLETALAPTRTARGRRPPATRR